MKIPVLDYRPDAPKTVEGNAALADSNKDSAGFPLGQKSNSGGGNSGAIISKSPGLGLSAYQDPNNVPKPQ